MHAIDAAVRPEVDDEQLAREVAERQRTGRVEPFGARREVRRPQRAWVLGGHSQLQKEE